MVKRTQFLLTWVKVQNFQNPELYKNLNLKLAVCQIHVYVISVLFCYAFMHVCLLMPCGHLLGKG